MKVGYAVTFKPQMASYRLRVAIPARHLGCPFVIGDVGEPTFFYKLGNPELAAECRGGVVFDVVNDHFDEYPSVKAMALLADVVTVGSEAMAGIVRKHTGRDSVVIDDPWENAESAAAVEGDRVAWFGHSVNLRSLERIAPTLRGMKLTVCTDFRHPNFVEWSRPNEDNVLKRASVVLMTGTNPGASSNRVVKAIRAGRFVVMPDDCAESWRQFQDFAWIGDVRGGIEWALNNREEACKKIQQGQKYVRERFDPALIGRRWRAVFDSILARAGSDSRVG